MKHQAILTMIDPNLFLTVTLTVILTLTDSGMMLQTMAVAGVSHCILNLWWPAGAYSQAQLCKEQTMCNHGITLSEWAGGNVAHMLEGRVTQDLSTCP